jgi:hypothetical protein
MATFLFFVKLNISNLTPSQLIERARALVIALMGNVDFPTPTPTLAAITTAADALEGAEAAVINNGGRKDYLTRNERERELRDLITLLGSYVQVTSGGDPEKILSAGFQTRKVAAPIGLLPAPKNLRALSTSMPGVIDLRWDRVRKRLIYVLEINLADPLLESDWKPLSLLGRNAYTVTELISGKFYSFRVRGIGAAVPSPWSDTAIEKPK